MKVSVVVITYNHERFIAQALDSILMQETPFPFEVVVHDDFSTDGTREILEEYRQRHSDRVRLLLAPHNLNTNEIMSRPFDASRGRYVALLDGDDYWTSPDKLRRQAEFLDSRPWCSTCFHNARILYEDESRPDTLHNPPDQRPLITIDDLWERNPIATCSAMFRNGLIRQWPTWFRDARYGDWPLHILNAQHGPIGYLGDAMATYRVHRASKFGGTTEAQQLTDILGFYDELDAGFDGAFHTPIERGRARHRALLEEAAPAGRGRAGRVVRALWQRVGGRAERPTASGGPRVSVLMIAYNVEDYIEQALESVLMQEGNFTCEVVVGEDQSTDRTREILLEYERSHPGRIRPILREQNLGMNANFAATYRECDGDYIALLDADDFWISRDKLQKQVEFMDAHPDCSVCFHNAMVVYDDGEEGQHPFHMRHPDRRISAQVPKQVSGLEDIVTGNFIQTCSVMYRGGLVNELPDWYLTMPTFDWPLHVLHAEAGAIAYLDDVLGTYRVHAGGFWSTGMSQYQRIDEVEQMLRAYETIDRHLEGRYHQQIENTLGYLHRAAVAALLDDGRYRDALGHWREYAARVGMARALADKSIARALARQLR